MPTKRLREFEESLSQEERAVFWLGSCVVMALAVLGVVHAAIHAFS